MTATVKRLFIYPIKSLRGIEVQAVELTDFGLRFDRSFVLIYDPKGAASDDGTSLVARHLTIKRVFRLALFQQHVDETWSNLTVTFTGCNPPVTLTIPLTFSPLANARTKTYLVNIFGTTARGIDVGQAAADFFSKYLQHDVRLVAISGAGCREIPDGAQLQSQHKSSMLAHEKGLRSQKIRFADAAPLLITSTTSEEDCRRRLQEEDRSEDLIVRFRTNIHIDAGSLPAYDEDKWQTLSVRKKTDISNGIVLRCILQCVRCLSINADMTTGGMAKRERQLYGLLASDRRINDKFPHKPVFGQYAFAGPAGALLRVGDEVTVVDRLA